MDLFGRQDQVLAGGLSSDSMFLTWPELAAAQQGLGMLVQRLGLEYRQPVRRIFELGPGLPPGTGGNNGNQKIQPSYYIIGRPEGKLQFGRFVGPNILAACFYSTYGSPCSTNVLTLSGKAGCRGSDPYGVTMTWVMNGVLLEMSGMDTTAEEMIIQEKVGAQFIGLNILANSVDLNTRCGGGLLGGQLTSVLTGIAGGIIGGITGGVSGN